MQALRQLDRFEYIVAHFISEFDGKQT